MKISKVETKLFEHTSYVESDDEGHGHPAKDPRKVSQCMVIIETDEGHKGYAFGAIDYGKLHLSVILQLPDLV